MPTKTRFLSELVCKGCGRTGHIAWEGLGDDKRAVEISDNNQRVPWQSADIYMPLLLDDVSVRLGVFAMVT
jgi:hypothetical protein